MLRTSSFNRVLHDLSRAFFDSVMFRCIFTSHDFRGAVLVGLALNAAVGTTLLQLIWHLVEEEVDIELVEVPPMGIILEQEDDGGNDSLP
ncbi:hypothetical protein quinque_006829 [Culex quinquefasciatus]